MAILGMLVNPKTLDTEDAGTDDEIYIGMWGTAGGREFPLSSRDHEDFDRGADDFYILGVDPGFGFSLIRSDRSAPGEDNDPALVPIDINSIQYVYVRKQAYGQLNFVDRREAPELRAQGLMSRAEVQVLLKIE